MVLAGRHGRGGAEDWKPLEALLIRLEIEIVAHDERLAHSAWLAFLQFGKGRHPAALNLGDCAAYALAKAHDLPLLFEGNDFSRTDVKVAAAPP